MAQILVIEDDFDLLYLYRTALAQAGHTVRMAGNLTEARAALQEFMPELVFLDMAMPDGRGVELIDDIHSDPRFDQMEIVVVTANEQWEIETEARNIEFFLVKPVTIESLVSLAARLTQKVR